MDLRTIDDIGFARDKPFLMFNALWFKPEGGWEGYRRYMELAAPLLKEYSARASKAGRPGRAILGSFDADLVFFVEYPDWNTFLAFTGVPRYRAIMAHREEALTRSLLIPCEMMD